MTDTTPRRCALLISSIVPIVTGAPAIAAADPDKAMVAPAPASSATLPPTLPGDSVYTEEVLKGLVGVTERTFELHGFVNLEGYDFRHDAERPTSSFDIHNVFLSTRANIADAVKLFIELEYEHGSAVKLDRAFIDFAVAGPLTIRVGRFSAPLSYERVHYAAPVRLMTSRPTMVDIAFHEWVDTGIEAFGRSGQLGYNLAVVNGPRGLTESGIPNDDVIDNNRNKTVIARVNYYPAASIESGAAASAGTYDVDNKRWFYLAELDARYRSGPLDIWGEAQFRTGDDEPCDASAMAVTAVTCDPAYVGDHAKKVGFYILAGYSVIHGWQHVHYLKPVVRYDEVDDLTAKTGRRRVSAGLNWSPHAHVVVKSELQASFPIGGTGEASQGVMMSAAADF